MRGARASLVLVLAFAHAAAAQTSGTRTTAAAATDANATDANALATQLGSDDPRTVERAVAAIAAGRDPDLLFAAGRACEDKLVEPARAAQLYARVVDEYPTARVASAAARRLAALRPTLGAGAHAGDARALAQLVARADALPPADVLARTSVLAGAAWPGAPDAALWLADWLRRTGRTLEAHARYAAIAQRWPDSPHARAALRGSAGCALDAHDWDLAERFARRLPAAPIHTASTPASHGDALGAAKRGSADSFADPGALAVADRISRDDLLRAAARGRRRDRIYLAAWLAMIGALVALVASLASAATRPLRRTLRPPLEALFLAPVAATLVGVAFTAHRLIAPAVALISLWGLAATYLSGAALAALRHRDRPTRARSLVHIALCLAGAIGVAYVAVTRDHLLDALIETVQFGPEG